MGFPGSSEVKNLPVKQKPQVMGVLSQDWEDPLEKERATHSHEIAKLDTTEPLSTQIISFYILFKVCACMAAVLNRFSHLQLFVTLWTVAYEAPLSMGFSRQEYWSGLPFPSQGIFPSQGSNLHLLRSLPLAPPGKTFIQRNFI